jgi:predicted  nucleic acid-binding Zn-ribbon protein
MVNLQKVFKELKRERKRAQKELEHLDDAISAFGKLAGKVGRRAAAETENTVRTVRRKVSAEARKRMAAAQRLRWAKVKRQALKKLT